MWPPFQKQRAKLSSRRNALRQRLNKRKLLVESLEDRRLLALVTWDGGGGDLLWSNPLNWSSDELPTSTDDVVINAPANLTILYDLAAPQSIKSIDLQEARCKLRTA